MLLELICVGEYRKIKQYVKYLFVDIFPLEHSIEMLVLMSQKTHKATKSAIMPFQTVAAASVLFFIALPLISYKA